jgi:hypothetical protein
VLAECRGRNAAKTILQQLMNPAMPLRAETTALYDDAGALLADYDNLPIAS